MLQSYEDMIISSLVKKGHQVGPASKDHKVSSGGKGTVSSVIALKIETEEKTASDLHTIIQNILTENKVVYYSLLVSSVGADCCWNSSGIPIPEPSPPPAVPGIKKTDMN